MQLFYMFVFGIYSQIVIKIQMQFYLLCVSYQVKLK